MVRWGRKIHPYYAEYLSALPAVLIFVPVIPNAAIAQDLHGFPPPFCGLSKMGEVGGGGFGPVIPNAAKNLF